MENKSVLNINNKEHFNEVFQFALSNNLLREFIAGINYLATYSESGEFKVCVDLYPAFAESTRRSFVACINRIVPNANYTDYILKRVITIGMVWREEKRNWEFHS